MGPPTSPLMSYCFFTGLPRVRPTREKWPLSSGVFTVRRKSGTLSEMVFSFRKSLYQLPRKRSPPDLTEMLSTDRKSTRLNSSHSQISYAVFCLKKKKKKTQQKNQTQSARKNTAQAN